MMVSKRKSWGMVADSKVMLENFSLGMLTNVEPKLRCKIFTLEMGIKHTITATSATNKKER